MIAYPDIRKNSSMYTDLAIEFVSNGHKTYVAVANGPGENTLNIEGGVNVLRINTLELFNTTFLKKGLANLLLPYQISRGLKIYFKNLKFDAVILSTPPITYLKIVKYLKKKQKTKIYLILRDIFPQNAKDLGIIKSSLLFKYFRKKEKKLYSVSDFIGCMSLGNINYISEHNPEVDKRKLHLLPNWKNLTDFKNADPEIRKQYTLENKFIALYGGNLGKPQEVGFILDLAAAIAYLKDVVFIIIGEGTEKKRMVEKSEKMNLSNIIFMDPLPRDEYQKLVKVCDVGLVNNSRLLTVPNIPSRTLSYWEAKLPILAAIDKNTDYSKILEKSGSGLWSITGDLDTYKQNFEKFYHNKGLRTLMGEKGYNYFNEYCTTKIAYSTIYNKLSD
jgi:glycosyltransferase involved in cell wall biosynthesis